MYSGSCQLYELEHSKYVFLIDIICCVRNDIHAYFSVLFQDLQTQIDSHQRQYELLNVAGKKITKTGDRGDDSTSTTPDVAVPGAGGAVDTQALKQRLDDMNERWSQLRAKTVQIRSVTFCTLV